MGRRHRPGTRGHPPARTLTVVRRVLPLVVVVLLATACSGGGGDAGPTSTSAPDTTAVIEVTTPPPVTEAVPETTIARGTPRTPTTQLTAMGPGSAQILGTVNGPEGPVTGAVVKVERFVGDAVAVADIRT
ncbi:MAG: hypothetical protein QOE93_2512, partial [Actinomycetota bacterium]|nr:hypothetical protein [Actinomycetota bacterium]